jgi:hypothetical protein
MCQISMSKLSGLETKAEPLTPGLFTAVLAFLSRFQGKRKPIFSDFRAGPVRIVKWKLETEPSRLSKVAERSS